MWPLVVGLCLEAINESSKRSSQEAVKIGVGGTALGITIARVIPAMMMIVLLCYLLQKKSESNTRPSIASSQLFKNTIESANMYSSLCDELRDEVAMIQRNISEACEQVKTQKKQINLDAVNDGFSKLKDLLLEINEFIDLSDKTPQQRSEGSIVSRIKKVIQARESLKSLSESLFRELQFDSVVIIKNISLVTKK